jgi:hypothetical protein
MKSHLQQPVLGVVPLATPRASHIAAPRRSALIVVFSDGEGCAAATGNEEHTKRLLVRVFRSRRSFIVWFHNLGKILRFFHDCQLVLLPLVGLQYLLAQAQSLGCDFNKFIIGNEFDSLLQVQRLERHQADRLIGR